MGICKWCHGTGRNHIEDSLYCRCEDCEGEGYIDECDHCGQEYTGEFCAECYAECTNCGAVELKCELNRELCAGCYEELQQQFVAEMII